MSQGSSFYRLLSALPLLLLREGAVWRERDASSFFPLSLSSTTSAEDLSLKLQKSARVEDLNGVITLGRYGEIVLKKQIPRMDPSSTIPTPTTPPARPTAVVPPPNWFRGVCGVPGDTFARAPERCESP